jgi:hypothetical protein
MDFDSAIGFLFEMFLPAYLLNAEVIVLSARGPRLPLPEEKQYSLARITADLIYLDGLWTRELPRLFVNITSPCQ